MAHHRPLECPACGHERITRRSGHRRNGPGLQRVGPSDWSCQLCGYAWSYPPTPRRDLLAEAE